MMTLRTAPASVHPCTWRLVPLELGLMGSIVLEPSCSQDCLRKLKMSRVFELRLLSLSWLGDGGGWGVAVPP